MMYMYIILILMSECVGVISFGLFAKRVIEKDQKIILDSKDQKTEDKNGSSGFSINKIVALIYTDTEPIIITQYDVERPTIDGNKRSLDELIIDLLMYYEATNVYKIPVPQDAVDKHIAFIKEQHGISHDQLVNLFKSAGYVYDDGVQQLIMMYTINTLLDFAVKSHAVVSEKEVNDYYEKNPEYEHASYYIKRGFIASPDLSVEDIQNAFHNGEENNLYVEWSKPYWIDEDEIAESKKFIMAMADCSVSIPEKVDNGYNIIKLLKHKDGKKLSLEERYKSILELLSYPKYELSLCNFKDELKKKYDIVYLDIASADKNTVIK